MSYGRMWNGLRPPHLRGRQPGVLHRAKSRRPPLWSPDMKMPHITSKQRCMHTPHAKPDASCMSWSVSTGDRVLAACGKGYMGYMRWAAVLPWAPM